MAVTKKTTMVDAVFESISAVYAYKGGFPSSTSGTLDISSLDLTELPCSEDSGFSYNGGSPSVSHFKVHGQVADWASRITPGDAEVTIEVPTYDPTVLAMLYGQEGNDLTVKLPTEIALGSDASKKAGKGKAFSFEQKAIVLGLLILNDTADKALFIKSVKVLATPSFDGSDKPYVVTLTGTLHNAGDSEAMAVLEPAASE